ncbi:MAG TPA: M48 family metallopeptidase [Ignavibacteria bacterium]|nr:M48 family metallopeptidase [Ignavibacteria bacterium]
MKNKKLFYSVVFSVLLLTSISVFYSCGANIFSESDDVAIGKDIDRQIKADPRQFPMLQGRPEVNDYVTRIGKTILTNSNFIQYENTFPYQFTVVNDTIVNAFCTPGGFIYVYTGLIKFLDNEAALAGVIGHEIAHAERRHMTQRLTSYYGVNAILGLVLGSNPNIFAEIAANLFVGLGFLANSRSDELEADNYSIRYLTATQWYPGSITFFFDKIREEQRQKGTTPGDLERLLSTHPLPQDRITNVSTQLRDLKINADPTKGLNTQEYQRIKSLLP